MTVLSSLLIPMCADQEAILAHHRTIKICENTVSCSGRQNSKLGLQPALVRLHSGSVMNPRKADIVLVVHCTAANGDEGANWDGRMLFPMHYTSGDVSFPSPEGDDIVMSSCKETCCLGCHDRHDVELAMLSDVS